jgi:hypothetical protein
MTKNMFGTRVEDPLVLRINGEKIFADLNVHRIFSSLKLTQLVPCNLEAASEYSRYMCTRVRKRNRERCGAFGVEDDESIELLLPDMSER